MISKETEAGIHIAVGWEKKYVSLGISNQMRNFRFFIDETNWIYNKNDGILNK